jgi:hypothetical protein
MRTMKKRIIVFAIVLIALAGLQLRAVLSLSRSVVLMQSASREVDSREILRAYESVRAAHFHHDAAAFLANNDTSWYLVADGTVALTTTAAEKPGVQEYFDSVKFVDITDLDPPHVEVSSDGTMAWMSGCAGLNAKRKGRRFRWLSRRHGSTFGRKEPADGESSPERTPRRKMLHTAEDSAFSARSPIFAV